MKFGLENMRTICAALDHPERAFRSVIVAGTNGKGSVTAMTSAALAAAGVRSARYTSPHLERLEERFVIAEHEVATRDLEEAAGTVQQVVEKLVHDSTLASLPTFFECATAIGFELFRRAAVEVAVVEVGLGGRLDATNVLTPVAAAITSIDLDHQELLGETLASIAREKAGVIKPGIPVVRGPMADEAADVIAQVCRDRNARLVDASRHALTLTPALEGAHQRTNAAVAVCLLNELRGLGIPMSDAAIHAGVTRVTWPGRLEHFTWHSADVLIDAAHNPAGARALARYLDDQGWHGVAMVLGLMRDKDATAMLDPLLPYAATVVCTTPPSPRALPASDLAALAATMAPRGVSISSIDDPAAALAAASQAAARIVAAGSIFLIGPLRGILR